MVFVAAGVFGAGFGGLAFVAFGGAGLTGGGPGVGGSVVTTTTGDGVGDGCTDADGLGDVAT